MKKITIVLISFLIVVSFGCVASANTKINIAAGVELARYRPGLFAEVQGGYRINEWLSAEGGAFIFLGEDDDIGENGFNIGIRAAASFDVYNYLALDVDARIVLGGIFSKYGDLGPVKEHMAFLVGPGITSTLRYSPKLRGYLDFKIFLFSVSQDGIDFGFVDGDYAIGMVYDINSSLEAGIKVKGTMAHGNFTGAIALDVGYKF